MYEERRANCTLKVTSCPPRLVESFNTFGSWMVSFGLGAWGVTLLLLLGHSLWRRSLPNLHWRTLRKAGVWAGVFWVLGSLFITLAVVAGGNAVELAQSMASLILTSGLCGMFWYRENGQRWEQRAVWLGAAVLTICSMVLLGMEKVA